MANKKPPYYYRKLRPEQKREVLRIRKMRGFPLHAPPHFLKPGTTFLLTGVCYEHAPLFYDPWDLTYLTMYALTKLWVSGMVVYGWVFLPNHYHVLLQHADTPIHSIIQNIHSHTALRQNRKDQTPGRKVWYRYMDREIRSQRHFMATLHYIHKNPVKHGYSDSVYSWFWSSIHVYRMTVGEERLEKMHREYPIDRYGEGWDL